MTGNVQSIELTEGYRIPRLINGGWQLSRGHATTDDPDPDRAQQDMERLAEAGLTVFDCADIYGGVEELLGRLRRRRPDLPLRIHTKFVPDLAALPRIDRTYVERVVDRSLRRLGAERLDLVQFHWWDFEIPGYVETACWLRELQRAGKIRLLGATNFDVPRLREVLDAGVGLVCNQVQYSLLDRRPENGMIAMCRRRGLRLLCYGALAGGFLAAEAWRGRPEPEPPLANRSLVKYRLIVDELGGWDTYQALLGALHEVAQRHGVSSGTVALRWLLDRPRVGAVIVGARDARHAEDNLRAFAIELDDADRERLDAALGTAAGPAGDIYSLERVRDGRHAAIMKYDLNAD
jgi:aryl-alcohol dehydrogenase-like predicted oxidoreductase